MPAAAPVISIQCDWNEMLWKPNGEVWVSAKFLNQLSIQGKLTTTSLTNEVPEVKGSPGFEVSSITKYSITVEHVDSAASTIFVAPSNNFVLHDKGIQSIDVTEGGLGVSSCMGDKVVIWETKTGTLRRELTGHASMIYRCRFFPSGVVVLTSSADMSVKVWSAETGLNAATLNGHTQGVTDIAIVERGKNVISVSKDGNAKLWDVGKSQCLADLVTADSINCCCLCSTTDVHPVQMEGEVGTEDKVLIVGCESGLVNSVAVSSRQPGFQLKLSSAVNACCVLSDSDERTILVGCHNGEVHVVNADTGALLNSFHESASPVLSLMKWGGGWITGRQDGTCEWMSLIAEQRFSLTGSDCDPIRDISNDGTNIFTACRDGLIRKYNGNKLMTTA